ncbi:MAG: electron transport complex subunit RsxC, partial [Spirochaetota bacterium]
MFQQSFSGGIHPPEHKEYTERKGVENIAIPHECFIPLQQHIGKPAVPVVEAGDYVEVGQLIAAADGFISANVHASVPGKVVAVRQHPTPASPHADCIVIETHGQFSQTRRETMDWTSLSPDELLTRIRDAGIVGMGGAAFPTHVKLSPPAEKTIDTLIVNAAECEPYLTVDDALIKTSVPQIIDGTRIILKILGIERAIIGIESNKTDSYRLLSTYLDTVDTRSITVKQLKTKYPQGAEKQLIFSLTKREVPSGGLPVDTGIVVQNIGTVFAVYQAVVENRPLIERLVTVSGSCITKPGNYKIKVGTRICDIIDECGGLREEPAKIILGGPMCGQAVNDTNIPVIKGTSGLLFLSKKDIDTADYQPCIRCARCVSVCPINLLPYEIANRTEMKVLDDISSLYPL